MIKYAALISVLVVMIGGQRPPYAGTANRYPLVLPRFQEEQDREMAAAAAATAAAAASAAGQGTTAGIGNRVGEETANSTGTLSGGVTSQGPAGAATTVTVSTSTVPPTTSELPVLALGQADYVDRIKTWPEDQRPFWYTNRQQVATHLNPVNQADAVRPSVNGRSFFAG